MSNHYQAVGWNRQKKIYDFLLALGVIAYLGLFALLHLLFFPTATAETILIRGLGTGAFLLLHIILSIGPLCRIDSRFLPLLYNRRHLGVAMFFLALAHGAVAFIQFHMFGDLNPFLSLFLSNGEYASLSQFPFQPLGLFALIILFLMAATSHDFWLANLTAPVWKSLHMLVYLAYGLLIGHVVLGVLQSETSAGLAVMVASGFVWVVGIHLVAAAKERHLDKDHPATDGFVDVAAVDEIPMNRAKVVTLAGERVAIFRYEDKISAVSNVCQHQNGPLGEGKVIDGCITCPWHGYQYRPKDGTSPPPFTEKIPTFDVRIEKGRVLVNPQPHPPGTPVEPAIVNSPAGGSA